MHPISKAFFGSTDSSLPVRYHNGSEIVTGYFVKQVGLYHYHVSDGQDTTKVSLAQTTEMAQYCDGVNPPPGNDYSVIAGMATIPAGTGYVRKLTSRHAYTTENTVVQWGIDVAPSDGIAITNYVTKVDETPSGGSGVTPIVFSDFKNGVYKLNGTVTPVENIWVESIDNWGEWNPQTDILDGVGIDPSIGHGPVIDHSILTDLWPSGFVFVITFHQGFTADPNDMIIDLTDFPDFAVENYARIGFTDSDTLRLGIFDGTHTEILPLDNPVGLHKVALLFTPSSYAGSFDGSSPSTFTPTAVTPTDFGFFCNQNSGIVEKVEIFSASDYGINDLDTLSTIPPVVALAVADFKNGIYSINGTSVTVANVVDQDAVNWGAFDPNTDIVPGTGLTGLPIIEHSLAQNILPGFVLIMTIRNSGYFGSAGFSVTDYPAYTVEWTGGIDGDGVDGTENYFDGHDGTLGDGRPKGSWTGTGLHKYAAVISSGQIAASVDGSGIITLGPNDNTPSDIAFFTNATDFVIEKIEFFSLSAYGASDLPSLSAP